MSKKKPKTRAEKEQKVHHLEHIAKSRVATIKSENVEDNNKTTKIKKAASPLEKYIKRDLLMTGIIIVSFVILIIIMAFITYKTGILNPLLSKWNIKY